MLISHGQRHHSHHHLSYHFLPSFPFVLLANAESKNRRKRIPKQKEDVYFLPHSIPHPGLFGPCKEMRERTPRTPGGKEVCEGIEEAVTCTGCWYVNNIPDLHSNRTNRVFALDAAPPDQSFTESDGFADMDQMDFDMGSETLGALQLNPTSSRH